MKKFYFTFLSNHVFANQVQVIVAPDMETAMSKMFELFGKDWGIDYTEERWLEAKASGSFKNTVERDYVYCGDPGITVGEMFELTKRFNQILGGAQCLKKGRLEQLLGDIEQSYQTYSIDGDHFATELAWTVGYEVLDAEEASI